MTVTIGPGCTACGACVVTCPARALMPAPRRPAVLDGRCTDCLACVEVCPPGVVSLAIAGSPAAVSDLGSEPASPGDLGSEPASPDWIPVPRTVIP